jgi:hypothetical protein
MRGDVSDVSPAIPIVGPYGGECLPLKYVLGWGEYTPWPSTLNEYSSGDSVM